MKRNVLTFFALALTTLAIGCSGGGGSGKKTDEKGLPQPGDVLPAGATRPMAISANKWCANFQDNTQLRLDLTATGAATFEQFALNDGARGGKLNEGKGVWYIENNNTMVYNIGDQPAQREPVRLDPNSPTGAPQLVFGAAPNTLAYDPCN